MSINVFNPAAGATTAQDLILTKYIGSFEEAFRAQAMIYGSANESNCVFKLPSTAGNAFQFLMDGQIDAPEDYQPGDTLLGQKAGSVQGIITSDKYVVAHHYIPKDQWKRWEQTPQKAANLGIQHQREIKLQMDRRIFATHALAARAASSSTANGLLVHGGGIRKTRTGGSVATAYPKSSTGAANFRSDLRDLAQQLDEANIPREPGTRMLYLTPYMNSVLLFDNTATLFSKDYIVSAGENNDILKREVQMIEGFTVAGIPNTTTNLGSMPDQNVTTGLSKFRGNFTPAASTGTPVAQIFCCGAAGERSVGMIEQDPLQHEMHYMPDKMSYLIMSYLLPGIGQMHPWCAASIEVIS